MRFRSNRLDALISFIRNTVKLFTYRSICLCFTDYFAFFIYAKKSKARLKAIPILFISIVYIFAGNYIACAFDYLNELVSW